MEAIKTNIETAIRNWTEFAYGVGTHLVSPKYYYSWLLRAKIADETTIKNALRELVDQGRIKAYTVPIVRKTEQNAYDLDPNQTHATVLALPEAEEREIAEQAIKKQKKKK